MATVANTIERVDTFFDDAHVMVWTPLTTTNADGAAIEMPGSSDRTIQFTGTFGAGGTVILQGSNFLSPTAGTDADWFTLTDPQGNAISKTAAAGEAVLELTRWIRPKVTAGDGTTAISARLLVKRK
jgi:polygalacturonase